MYNATSKSWTRFPTGLGQARFNLAAASLPSHGLVFFAGGEAGIKTSACDCQLRLVSFCCRELTTTVLLRCCVPLLLRACVGGCSDACASDWWNSATGDNCFYVDMYSATSNSWTRFPTGLGQARTRLAAASLPSQGLVFFAGGYYGIMTSACVCQLRLVSLLCRNLMNLFSCIAAYR